jgi:hypothetical protein
MPIKISAEAQAAIDAKAVKMYGVGKLYNFDGTYLADLDIHNASYSKSREFNVNSMNIQLVNTNNQYTSGALEIKQDYTIVLIEGYDTTTATDKIPTFKGRIKDINHTNTANDNTLNITCYGELMLLQRSDLDKTYVADAVYVDDELLEPIIDNPAGIITHISQPFVRIDETSELLGTLITTKSIVIDKILHIIESVARQPNKKTPDGIQIGYTNLVGTLQVGETIISEDGTFSGTYHSSITDANGITGYNFIVVDSEDTTKNGMILIGETSGARLTVYHSYYVKVRYIFDARQSTEHIQMNNIIHSGVVDKFKAANSNWAAFKTHIINTHMIAGDVGKDERFDGYEINESLGIVKFNEPIKINEKEVKAKYYYYPIGLHIEDVITELITEPDQLKVNILKNQNFKQNGEHWTIADDGATDKYSVLYSKGVRIAANADITGANYVKITQPVIWSNGYVYNIRFNAETTGAATYGIFINGVEQATGSIPNSVATITHQYTSTLSSANNFEIRLYTIEKHKTVRINDVQVLYSPAKVNAFTKQNLYCTLLTENGHTDAYDLVKREGYTVTPKYNTLIDDVVNTSTTIKLKDSSGFESTGIIKINSELIEYTTNVDHELGGLTRGYNNTEIEDHLMGNRVWEVLPAGRVWLMEYSNIIPLTQNATASDDVATGIDLVAGDFTVTGSTFNMIYYRQGMVITNAVATKVTLQAAKNYTFNHIQSTGIETPYILIDYKKMNNKFDAINEIRTMLAPNYVIDETVRLVGSEYITYIRGRYLTQKSVKDYNLDLITDINYSQPLNNYNRVKMFGKQSNPVNLMYDDAAMVINTNEMQAQYLRGIGYQYQYDDGTNYVFSNEIQVAFMPDRSFNIGFMTTTNRQRQESAFTTEYNTLTRVIASHERQTSFERSAVLTQLASIDYNGTATIGSIQAFPEIKETWTDSNNREQYQHIKVLKFYNVFFVNYDTDAFLVNTEITGGGLTGIIKRIDVLNTNDMYHALLYVEMDKTAATPFDNAQAVTSGTLTGTVFRVLVNGITGYVNYNYEQNPTYANVVLKNYIFHDYNDAVNFSPTDSISKLYIDDVEVNVDRNSWQEITATFAKGWNGGEFAGCRCWFPPKFRNRYNTFDNSGIYINNDYDEFAQNNHIPDGNIIPWGTVRLVKVDAGANIHSNHHNLWQLDYRGQPHRDVKPGWRRWDDRGDILSNLCDRGNLSYDARHDSWGQQSHVGKPPASAINKATHIIFWKRFKYDIDYEIIGDFLYIPKAQFPIGVNPNEVKIKVDGEFTFNIHPEYIGTENVPTITRLRTDYTNGRHSQVSVVSKVPIESVDLFVIDLGSVKEVGLIDIQGGFLYKPSWSGDNNRYDTKFTFTLLYCDKDEDYPNLTTNDFTLISPETEDVSGSSGDITTLTESELGEYFKTRYIKVQVSTNNESDIEEGLEKEKSDGTKDRTYMKEYYGAAISSMAIYDSGILSSEQYVDAEVINLYKDTTVYEELHTQELLDNYAKANLAEFQKNNTRVAASSAIGTHYDMGMTLDINGTNYFVEEISSTNGANALTLARYE